LKVPTSSADEKIVEEESADRIHKTDSGDKCILFLGNGEVLEGNFVKERVEAGTAGLE
jgi:hypothetical protein